MKNCNSALKIIKFDRIFIFLCLQSFILTECSLPPRFALLTCTTALSTRWMFHWLHHLNRTRTVACSVLSVNKELYFL